MIKKILLLAIVLILTLATNISPVFAAEVSYQWVGQVNNNVNYNTNVTASELTALTGYTVLYLIVGNIDVGGYIVKGIEVRFASQPNEAALVKLDNKFAPLVRVGGQNIGDRLDARIDSLGGGHTHSNLTILNAITESFTTSLKGSYDWLVTNITSTWKNTVDTFISSKGQVSGIAPLDANSKVPTVNLGGSDADSSKYLRGDQTWAAIASSGESENVVVLADDVGNSTVNLADATGLSFIADASSTYIIEVFLLWNTSATTVGIKTSASATNSPTINAGHFITDAAAGTPDSTSYNATNVVTTTSASAFTAYNSGMLHSILKTSGSASTWVLRFAAETTGTITIKSGSVLRYRKVS